MHNHQIELMISYKYGDLSDKSIAAALSEIDVESIEDHHTKVIARTIKGSIEALREYLEICSQQAHTAI